MAWTPLLILALIVSPALVAIGVAAMVHMAKPAVSTASPVSADQPILRDPIDTDGPGATFSGGPR